MHITKSGISEKTCCFVHVSQKTIAGQCGYAVSFRMLMLMFCVFPYCFLPFSAFTAIFGVVVLDSAGERCSFVGESCFVPSFGICVPY